MGILVFYPGESDLEANAHISIDIIAIHGLNGHQLNTWTEPKSKKLWLRDFLPKDLRGTRVMTFGYDATAAFANSVAGISDHARSLLGELIEKRGKNYESKRPLIFIGHSLGGLVIKQALIIAEQESPYKHIFNNTLGIIFFGTPHKGSSIANYATTLTRTLLILANKPNSELLESLRKGSPSLKQLGEEWKEHHDRRPYGIVSFYETRTMKGLRDLIVEKSSALLTPQSEVPTYEDQIPVNATHREMCQFASPKDQTYKALIRSIKRIQHGSEVEVKNEFYVVPHAASEHFTGRNEIRERLSGALLSCRTSKTQQRFVLYGLGGSGKTQICLKFAEDNRESFWGIFWIDASSEETAQEGFLHLARTCKQEESIESAKSWLSRKDHWLLILDNADAPDLDVSKFFPSRERGTILITTRNPNLRKHGTAGFCRVDQLSTQDAVTLLLRTAAVEDLENQNKRQFAEQIINVLGCLALAINQAGAVIRQGLCSFNSFCDVYSKQKREVLESGISMSSVESYQYSVFTTWEISIKKIEQMSEGYAKLALELLRLFSWMHFDSIREEIFKSALENSMAMSDPAVFKNSLLAQCMPNGWDGLLWCMAIRLLATFSLITSHSEQISMHPLVHLWSRDRMSKSERADTWKTAMVTLSISATFNAADEQKRQLLLPHIDSLVEHDDGQLFAPDQDLMEMSMAASKFHLIYLEGEQFQKALRIAQANLKSKEKLLDPKDIDHLRARFMVGKNLQLLHRFREAVDWLEPLMKDLADSIHYAIILQVTEALGCSYNRLEEFQSAFNLSTKTMAKFEGIFTGEAPEILPLYSVMGNALWGLNKPKEALIWTKKAFLGSQKIYGATHSITLITMGVLASYYAYLNDFKKAYDLQEQSMNCMKETLGADHPLTISSESYLVDIISQRKRNLFLRKKVIGRRRMLLQKMNTQLGDKNWRTLDCQLALAQDYVACGSLEKAKVIEEQWVEVMIQEFGQDDKRTLEGIAALALTKKLITARKVLYWWVPRRFLK